MKKVYLDNGSTSYPKAPGVGEAIAHFINEVGCNVGRTSSEDANDLAFVVYETSKMLVDLVNFPDPKNVVYTMNVTQSLNMVIKGYLKSGDHVIISPIEHNAVMRPIEQLRKQGLEVSEMKLDDNNQICISSLKDMIKPNTKAIVMLHASNVTGNIFNLKPVGEVAKDNNIKFIVDSAQTLGILPIDMQALNIDALCFTGHKSLLAAQGIGGFIVNDEFAKEIDAVISGGTGSISSSIDIPEFMPDKFQAGTMNLPGIYGLHTALKYITSRQSPLEEEQALVARLQKGIEGDKVKVIGERDPFKRCPTLSVDFVGMDNSEVAFRLQDEFGIATRCGLHCAPNAHRHFGSYPEGTVRFSVGYSNTIEDIDYTISAIYKIIDNYFL